MSSEIEIYADVCQNNHVSTDSGLGIGSHDLANAKRARCAGHSRWRQSAGTCNITGRSYPLYYFGLARLQTMRCCGDGSFRSLVKMHHTYNTYRKNIFQMLQKNYITLRASLICPNRRVSPRHGVAGGCYFTHQTTTVVDINNLLI